MGLNNSKNNDKDNVELATQIFNQYGDLIRNIILYYSNNRDSVDDLFQKFFLSLVSNPIPNDTEIKNYLYKAIHNDIIDAKRHEQRYLTNIEKYQKKIETPIKKNTTADALIEEEQENLMFELIKEQLPSSQCSKAIILRYREGYNRAEIAEIMGLKKDTVSRYLTTGLQKIRKIWGIKDIKQDKKQ
ncbi:RNA polymerase sigma factor [Planctomycetota bacterium]